jgi:hypothetical protein
MAHSVDRCRSRTLSDWDGLRGCGFRAIRGILGPYTGRGRRVSGDVGLKKGHS